MQIDKKKRVAGSLKNYSEEKLNSHLTFIQ